MSKTASSARRLSELAQHVGGELEGDGGLTIVGVSGLAEARPDEISFFGNNRYRAELEKTKAGAVLVGPDFEVTRDRNCVRVENPHLAFAKISRLFHPRATFPAGTSPRAYVHPEAEVSAEATVMGGATVDRHACVARGAVLFPGSYVGEGARVGEDSWLYPNVVVREGCLVGARVILHAGAVIGADGFGFALDLEAQEHVKIPQAGIVRIEDDVEIGACSCIDRATLGETVVGKGTKIDNLVQIAHNVKVGPLTLVCAQAGISGSAELGTGVVLAGQVGVVGHIRVGDMAKVGAQSGVAHDVADGKVVSGSPAFDHREWLKVSAALGQLPSLVREVRQLKKRVAQLEGEQSR